MAVFHGPTIATLIALFLFSALSSATIDPGFVTNELVVSTEELRPPIRSRIYSPKRHDAGSAAHVVEFSLQCTLRSSPKRRLCVSRLRWDSVLGATKRDRNENDPSDDEEGGDKKGWWFSRLRKRFQRSSSDEDETAEPNDSSKEGDGKESAKNKKQLTAAERRAMENERLNNALAAALAGRDMSDAEEKLYDEIGKDSSKKIDVLKALDIVEDNLLDMREKLTGILAEGGNALTNEEKKKVVQLREAIDRERRIKQDAQLKQKMRLQVEDAARLEQRRYSAEQREKELENRRASMEKRKIQQERQRAIAKAASGGDDKKNKFQFGPAPKEKTNQDGGNDEAQDKSDDESGDFRSTFMSGYNTASNFVSGVWDSAFSSKDNEEENWVVVGPKTMIAPGQLVPVVAAGLDLLLVASKDGKRLHCIANECPHLGTPLETGMIERRPIEYSIGTKKVPSVGRSSKGPTSATQGLDEEIEDGCEECIVCPLHQTAFALQSGEVRGDWSPEPPVIGKMMGTIKGKSNLPIFLVRTQGKNIEVLISSSLDADKKDEGSNKKKDR